MSIPHHWGVSICTRIIYIAVAPVGIPALDPTLSYYQFPSAAGNLVQVRVLMIDPHCHQRPRTIITRPIIVLIAPLVKTLFNPTTCSIGLLIHALIGHQLIWGETSCISTYVENCRRPISKSMMVRAIWSCHNEMSLETVLTTNV